MTEPEPGDRTVSRPGGSGCVVPRSFYDRDAVAVARDLLGKHLVRRLDGSLRVGRIVEVEAYLGPHDAASHASRGLTPRTRPMFGPPGHAYVYLIYGLHHCLNVVTGPEGTAAAVLVRAVEPVDDMSGGICGRTDGPGRLTRAMGIDRALNGIELQGPELWIEAPQVEPRITIVTRARVGVESAGSWARRLLRFYVKGSPYVSRR